MKEALALASYSLALDWTKETKEKAVVGNGRVVRLVLVLTSKIITTKLGLMG